MSRVKQGDYVYIDCNLIKSLNDLGITNGKEIMLFAKILSLSKKEKACKASNDYFSNFFCTTSRNIRKYLEDLKDKELIKVFEEKEGMRTTTRYIYPQYDKLMLAAEEMFLCSDEGAEQNGNSSGTDDPEERNIHSEPAEQMIPLIIDGNRLEQISIETENQTNAASATPTPNNQTKNKTKTNPNKKKKTILDKVTDEQRTIIWDLFNEGGHDYDEMADASGVDFGDKTHSIIYKIIEYGKDHNFMTPEQEEAMKRVAESMIDNAISDDYSVEEYNKIQDEVWKKKMEKAEAERLEVERNSKTVVEQLEEQLEREEREEAEGIFW